MGPLQGGSANGLQSTQGGMVLQGGAYSPQMTYGGVPSAGTLTGAWPSSNQPTKNAGANNSGATAGSGSTSGSSAINASQINNTYDTSSNFYNKMLGTIDPTQNAHNATTNQYYDTQQAGLQGQRDSAFANLDNQTRVANQSYQKSLQQLGNNIRNTYQGQQNALGTQGAGDSSATGMLGYALGQQQNQQRGYMNDDVNNQMTQIVLTKDSDQKQFQNQSDQVQSLRGQALQGIADQYNNLRQQINGQLANNEQARKQALMYAGQWAQGKASGIDQRIAGSLQSSINAFNPANLPKVQMTDMPSYTAHNVVAPTVAAQSDLSRPASTSAPMQQIYSPYKDQNNALGF